MELGRKDARPLADDLLALIPNDGSEGAQAAAFAIAETINLYRQSRTKKRG